MPENIVRTPHETIKELAPQLAVLTAMEKVIKAKKSEIYAEVKDAADAAYEIDGSTARDVNLGGKKVARLTCSIKDGYEVVDGRAFDKWLLENNAAAEVIEINTGIMSESQKKALNEFLEKENIIESRRVMPCKDFDKDFQGVAGGAVISGLGEVVDGIEAKTTHAYRFTAQKPEVVSAALKASGEDISISGLLEN